VDGRRALAALAVAGLLAGCGSSSSTAGQPTPSPTVPPSDGIGQYQAGSAATGDQCNRSTLAYPVLADAAKQLGKLTFVACAGAVTSDLVSPNHDHNTSPVTHAIEPAQISSIPVHTKSVTLTIGGNDAGFASVLASCVTGKVGPITVFPHVFESFGGCHGNATLNQTVTTRLQALAGTTEAKTPEGTPIVAILVLLARIHLQAPQAHIYLVGYPALFGASKSSCHVGDVSVLHVPLFGSVHAGLSVSAADVAWLNGVAGRLNAVLSAAATTAATRGVSATFVDVSAKFAGHRLCDSAASWIAPVTGHADLSSRTAGLDASSFHPTAAGQRGGYAAALLAAGIS
jgi:GDSL-like Lipase/Acylhydrolase family